MPSYTVDDDTLREHLDDPDAARARVEELEQMGDAGDAERIAWLRMLGELDDAERLARRRVADAGGGTKSIPLSAVRFAVRLAHVIHWQGRFGESATVYAAVLRKLRSAPPSAYSQADVAFAFQQAGKLMFDTDHLDAARACFERALRIREIIDAPQHQLASTRQALAAVERAAERRTRSRQFAISAS